MKMKNRSHKYDINRPRPRHGQKYTNYKKCISMMLICIKKHLSNIRSSVYEKVENTEAELKKSVAYIKTFVVCKLLSFYRKLCQSQDYY